MGVYKYPPKYKNPNWSPYSKKKQLWDKYNKKSSQDSKKSNENKNTTIKK